MEWYRFHRGIPRATSSLYNKVILSVIVVCLFVCLCALGSAKLPNGFEKFFLRLVDLNVDIVRKILDFYMS